MVPRFSFFAAVKNNSGKHLKAAIADIKNWKRGFAIIFATVLIITLLGFFFYFLFPPELKTGLAIAFFSSINEKLEPQIESNVQQTSVSNPGSLQMPLEIILFGFVFLNNLTVALLGFSGMLLLLVPGIFLSFFFGAYWGLFIEMFLKEAAIYGVNPIFYILSHYGIHGIFETIAVLFSYVLGAALCFKLLLGNRVFKGVARRIFTLKILRLFVLVVLPLLLIAAFLEIFVSPATAQFFSSGKLLSKYRDPGMENLIIGENEVSQILGFEIKQFAEADLKKLVQNFDYVNASNTYYTYLFSSGYPKLKDHYRMKAFSKSFEAKDKLNGITIWLMKPENKELEAFSLQYLESKLNDMELKSQGDSNNVFPKCYSSELLAAILGNINGYIVLIYIDTEDKSKAFALFEEQSKKLQRQ